MGLPPRLPAVRVLLLCFIRGGLLRSRRGGTAPRGAMAAITLLDSVPRPLRVRKDDKASPTSVEEPGRCPLHPGLNTFWLFP
jgi:hypothetical protein